MSLSEFMFHVLASLFAFGLAGIISKWAKKRRQQMRLGR